MMSTIIHRILCLFFLVATLCIITVQNDDKFGDNRQNTSQCPINTLLYKELRLLNGDEEKTKLKTCSIPGCFYVYPPTNGPNFMPHQLIEKGNSIGGGESLLASLHGCRSDIPFLLQRSAFSMDVKLHKLLRYLRACFVKDPQKRAYTKKCQPEWANKTDNALNKRSWLEQNAYFAENKCFYPFHNEAIFYVSFGQRSEGRVICCSDGQRGHKAFQNSCYKVSQQIYNREWRKGQDGD